MVVIAFIITLLIATGHVLYKNEKSKERISEILLSYLLLINLGVMSLLAFYAHVFMGPETARMIGWEPGSPFQYEIGMANLTFGILGVVSFWKRGNFWLASVIGWNIFFIGCMIGHIKEYFLYNNTAPYNIGMNIWFADLIIPLLALTLLIFTRRKF